MPRAFPTLQSCVLFVLVAVAACSKEEVDEDRPSTARLALRTELAPDAADQKPRPKDDAFDFAGDDAQGWTLQATNGSVRIRGGAVWFERAEEAAGPLQIARDMVLETHDADELRFRVRGRGKVEVEWTAMLSEEAFPDRAEVVAEGDHAVVVQFAGRPGWRGMLRNITLRVVEQDGPLAIDDITFGRGARLAALDAAGDALQFLGGEGRPGIALTAGRRLVAPHGALRAGDRIQLAFGVPEESVGGGALRIVVKGAGEDQPLSLQRKLGWADREIRLGADLPAGELAIVLEGNPRDLVLVGAPVVLPAVEVAAEAGAEPGQALARGEKSVLLITVGSLRNDALGCSLSPLKTTSTSIDALAGYGVLMDNVTTASNATAPAVASILTSLYPKDHGVVANGDRLPAEATTLAEMFRDAGYATMASVGSGVLAADGSGFGQGFDTFFGGDRLANRPAAAVNADALPWLEAHRDRPLFAWVHYSDLDPPHTPPAVFAGSYYPGDPKDAKHAGLPFPAADPAYAFLDGARDVRYGVALYQGEVSALDTDVNKLLTKMHGLGLWNRAAILLVGDRGESLTEHSVFFSDAGLFGETVLVPWILMLPQQPARKAPYSAPAETIDVAPTVLEFAGIARPGAMRGTSRLSAATEAVDPAAVALTDAGVEEMETGAPAVQSKRWFQAGGNVAAGLRVERFQAVVNLAPHQRGLVKVTPGVELYDLLMDRRMTKNVANERRPIAESMAAEIRAWLAEKRAPGAGP
jgi:arylsulfatase A-like enzyme